MLTDVEQIIASRFIWTFLESKAEYALNDYNLRNIAIQAELVDKKTQFDIDKITTYLQEQLSESYLRWAFPNRAGLKELLVKTP
jgi:hypothetical protein